MSACQEHPRVSVDTAGPPRASFCHVTVGECEWVEGVRMGAAWGWATWVAAEGEVVGRAASVMLAELASEVAEMVAAYTGVAMVLETADTAVTWAALMEVVVAREATVVGVVGLAALKVHPA